MLYCKWLVWQNYDYTTLGHSKKHGLHLDTMAIFVGLIACAFMFSWWTQNFGCLYTYTCHACMALSIQYSNWLQVVLWCMAFKVHYDHNSYSTIIVTLTGNSSLALYKQALCSCHCRLIAFTLQFASSFFYLSDEHYPERLPNCRE